MSYRDDPNDIRESKIERLLKERAVLSASPITNQSKIKVIDSLLDSLQNEVSDEEVYEEDLPKKTKPISDEEKPMKKITNWICIIGLVISVILIICGQNIDTHDNSSYSSNHYTASTDLPSVPSISIPEFSISEFTLSDDVYNSSHSNPQKTIVYITETGVKYHRSYCQYLYDSKYAIDLEKAIARGYTRCSKCNPPRQ